MQTIAIDAERRSTLSEPHSAEGHLAGRGMDERIFLNAGDDPAELEALGRDCRERLRPQGPAETFLVDSMIYHDWRRRRGVRQELELLRTRPPGAARGRRVAVVERLLRSCEREWMRDLKELQRLQKARRADKGVR